MTSPVEAFEQILSDDELDNVNYTGCNVLLGLEIIAKYLPKEGIVAAEHDVVYSVSVAEIVDAGISESDVVTLRQLGWMVDNGCLARFV